MAEVNFGNRNKGTGTFRMVKEESSSPECAVSKRYLSRSSSPRRPATKFIHDTFNIMELRQLQKRIEDSSNSNPFKNPQEIMLALTEELGEVAQEVALLEKVGNKANWEKEPSKERLTKEIRDLLNCVIVLSNHYEIDLENEYSDQN